MRIAFDIDGVVLNSIEVILEHINHVMGKNIVIDELVSWELEALGVDFKTLWAAVDYMYRQPKIEPYHGALETLTKIHKETSEPLLFITGRRDPETAQRQLRALDWNGHMPEMIVTGGTRDKRTYLIDNAVDFIIEDDVQHFRDYIEAGIGVGLMVRPWNRKASVPVTRRFEGWHDLWEWVREVKSLDG